MPILISALDDILEPYRVRDWDECARRLRLAVDGDPFATLPRHVLANLCARLGQQPLALLHYEKLLPVAVGKGELLRAIVVQRRIDELQAHPNAASRFAAMHRWFRVLGERNLAHRPGLHQQGISAPGLLRLPPEAFVRAALGCVIEPLELEPRSATVESGTQWIVLWGSACWRLAAGHGPGVAEGRAEEGHTVRADRVRNAQLELRIAPETPGEWVRFGRELMEELLHVDPTLGHDPLLDSDIVRDERPRFVPRTHGPMDFDRRERRHLVTGGDAPPRLDLSALRAPRDDRPRDTGDWLEFGQLELGPPGEDPRAEPASGGAEPPADAVPSVAPEAAEAAVAGGSGDERRSVRRVPVGFAARVALLGLSTPTGAALVGDVVDLSMGGLGLRFPNSELQHALTVLKDETLRLDLITPAGTFLQLAGRVRWLDFQGAGHVAGGVQFVLLTDADREAIARLVMDADPGTPAAGEPAPS